MPTDLAKYLVADLIIKIDNGRTLRNYLRVMDVQGRVTFVNTDTSLRTEDGYTMLYWYVANVNVYFEHVDVLVTKNQTFAVVIKADDEDRFHYPPYDFNVPFTIRVLE